MLKKFFLTSFLLVGAFITIYPSKKENTNFFDYCYSLEKIISRNSVEKNKKLLNNFKPLVNDFALFGTKKTKGTFANKIIDQYKNSKNLFIITVVPNQIYCLAGYWIEEVSPGKFESIFYEKTKQKINEYKNTKKEVDKFIKEINLEYKSIKKEINDFFQKIKIFFSNKIDLFVMVDSFFLDCEIKNSSNPKIITNPKIDKV